MKKGLISILLGMYMLSTVCFSANLMSEAKNDQSSKEITPTDLGIMCISQGYPGAETVLTDSRDNNLPTEESGYGTENQGEGKTTEEESKADGKDKKDKVVVSEEPKKEKTFGKDPVVLIVHTHATESYVPSTQGNYHTTDRVNTVRDVGDVLANTLVENGVPCVHDETLHDHPSYNMSYSRSAVTISSLLEKYPSVKCVIDLHRDATTSDAAAATITAEDMECAPYSFVVSNVASTYKSNMTFVNSYNNVANRDFGGFSGEILMRGYEYNQSLSSKYMLMEIGYNRNDIEDSRNTAKLVGKILAQTLKETD